MRWVVLALVLLLARPGITAEERCRYEVTVWSAVERRTTRTIRVDKPRSALGADEIGPLGCTPCREDQVEVPLTNGRSVTLCRAIAADVARALEGALAEGAVIETILGYRPSMSRGHADENGERTLLSNHAFGVALDVNEAWNGLYQDCPTWGESCLLMKGGAWQPADPRGLRRRSPLVVALGEAGLKWGGAIEGTQKDFMHFSPTGY